MTTYMFIDIEVTDPEAFAEFRRRPPEAVKGYGGHIVASGDVAHSTDGGAEGRRRRMVLLQFETMGQAMAYFEFRDPTPEQKEVRELRNSMGDVYSIKVVETD